MHGRNPTPTILPSASNQCLCNFFPSLNVWIVKVQLFWHYFWCRREGVLPGVEAEAAPGFTASAGLVIAGRRLSSIGDLRCAAKQIVRGKAVISRAVHVRVRERDQTKTDVLTEWCAPVKISVRMHVQLGFYLKITTAHQSLLALLPNNQRYNPPPLTDLRSVPMQKSPLITLLALVIFVPLELWRSDVN